MQKSVGAVAHGRQKSVTLSGQHLKKKLSFRLCKNSVNLNFMYVALLKSDKKRKAQTSSK
jgi:hypothetical protein